MTFKVIKTLNENSTKCFGANLTIYIIRDVKKTLDTLFGFYTEVVRLFRIIIGSFKLGFIDLAH